MMINTGIYTVFCWVILLYFQGATELYAQEGYPLSIKDCQEGKGLDRVIVLDAQYNLLGETDEEGICNLSRLPDLPIILGKLGYDIQVVYEYDKLDEICLQPKVVNLGEVVVPSNGLSVQDYLLELRDRNAQIAVRDTTLFYAFSYLLEFPDQNWKEEIRGFISYKVAKRGSKSGLLQSEYLNFDYKSTDTAFWDSDEYQTLKTITSGHLLSYDMMGTSIGFGLWDKIVSPKKRNVRQLTVYEGIDSLIEFKSYYDTSNHVMERIVFNKNQGLKTVELFLPEHKPIKQLKFSSISKSKTHPINFNKDLFYSRYAYEQSPSGGILTGLYHVSTYENKGIFCKKTIRLTLVNNTVSGNIRIPNIIVPLNGMEALRLIKGGYNKNKAGK